MSQLERQLAIASNITLSRAGLMIDGRVELLGHAGRFNQIVQLAVPAVVSVLSAIFPKAKAVPLPDGTVAPSDESAAEHFKRHAQILREYPAASPKAIEASCILLQWCVAAQVAAEVAKLPVEQDPEFLAIEFLTEYGPAAASCNATQWQAHQLWLAEERTLEAFLARMDGRNKKSPLPAPLYICAPWPEYLGAGLGKLGAADSLCYLFTDVICHNSQTLCRFRRNLMVRLESTASQCWKEKVEAAAQGTSDKFFDCALEGNHDGIDYVIRAQKTIVNDMPRYAFRMLRSSVPDLEPFLDKHKIDLK